MRYGIGVVIIVGLTLVLWQTMYPDQYDPKGLHYVLWKHHLAYMDVERASEIITHDRDRNSMILGRTKAELTQRFGYLKSPAEVRLYLRDYCWGARPGSDAMFLRDRDLMIVFTDGRATDIVTCEG